MDNPSACSAVEGLGCPCGALTGAWRCVGSAPVCVCPMPDAARVDVPRDMGVAVGRCMSDNDCNDRIDCTLDECVDGACTHAPVNNFCPTGHRCTADRGCTTGFVCGRDTDCNDNIPCTRDMCTIGGACMNVRNDFMCASGMRCSATLGCIASDPSMPDAAVPFPCAIGSLYCASIRACVDISLNRAHCGACDRACASSEMCVQGACVRPDAGVRDA